MKQRKLRWISLFFVLCFMPFAYGQIKVETLVDQIEASGGVKIYENNLYVANFGQSLDNANGREVYQISKSGEVQVFATGLFGASGNDFDSEGNLFQSNIAAGAVSKITPQGQVSAFASTDISCNVGIAIDDQDNLYVCNCCGQYGNTIRKITSQGQVSLFASGALFNCPNGITIDPDNNLYVSNFGNGNIIRITPNGQTSLLATTPGTSNSSASNGHLSYSPQENVLYVASHGSHSLYRLSLDGILTRIAGTGARGNLDGDAAEATFSRPNGIAITSGGDTMYVNSSIPVTDAGGRPLNPSKIRMITGFYTTTNLDDRNASHFKFETYPNPVQNQLNLTVELEAPQKLSVKLYDMLGNEVLSKEFQGIVGSNQLDINTEKLNTGHYALNLGCDKFFKTTLIQKK